MNSVNEWSARERSWSIRTPVPAGHALWKVRHRVASGLAYGTVLLALVLGSSVHGKTWAERLGWPADARVLIVHVDDAGMSHESNLGSIQAIEEGIANSVSLMTPTPWIGEMAGYLRRNPQVDGGVHLTLTSEWRDYRWRPTLGVDTVPGLIDQDGAMWRNVVGVVSNAKVAEVEAEVRAQIAHARRLGFEPTHVDSHMGTLFATDELLELYVDVAIDEGVPAMIPGGHNTLLLAQLKEERRGRTEAIDVATMELLATQMAQLERLGERLWAAGFPVLDDLHNTSYGWRPPVDSPAAQSDDALREYKVERYLKALRELRPGITMMINHATDAGDHFSVISGSGLTRRGDLLALTDPRLAVELERQGIVLTTWRELHHRRQALLATASVLE